MTNWKPKLQKLIHDYTDGAYFEGDPNRYNGTKITDIFAYVEKVIKKERKDERLKVINSVESEYNVNIQAIDNYLQQKQGE